MYTWIDRSGEHWKRHAESIVVSGLFIVSLLVSGYGLRNTRKQESVTRKRAVLSISSLPDFRWVRKARAGQRHFIPIMEEGSLNHRWAFGREYRETAFLFPLFRRFNFCLAGGVSWSGCHLKGFQGIWWKSKRNDKTDASASICRCEGGLLRNLLFQAHADPNPLMNPCRSNVRHRSFTVPMIMFAHSTGRSFSKRFKHSLTFS